MSRHQLGVATPLKPLQVATSRRGRDTTSLPTPLPMSRPHFDVATSRQPESRRDIKSVSRHHSVLSRSRRQFHVATSWRLTYVATSNPCRDLPDCCPCRDVKMMSRHQAQPSHCRPCRDIQFMSRHQFLLAVSRHQNGVATPLRSPSVATSKMVSRPQVSSGPFLLRRDAAFPCRDVPCCHPSHDLKLMSRHPIQPAATQPGRDVPFLVATSRPSRPANLTSAMSRRQNGCRDTNFSSLGRDTSWTSRPRLIWPSSRARCPGRGSVLAMSRAAARTAAPALRTYCLPVTTSKLGRDPVLEIGSSHSSFCLTLKKFFFFSNPPVAFPATPRPFQPLQNLLPLDDAVT